MLGVESQSAHCACMHCAVYTRHVLLPETRSVVQGCKHLHQTAQLSLKMKMESRSAEVDMLTAVKIHAHCDSLCQCQTQGP